jgi:hypothetical protein
MACQHLSSGANLRVCEDQRFFKVQADPVFRFDLCKMFSHTPLRYLRISLGVRVTQVEDHCSGVLSEISHFIYFVL